MRDTSDSSKIYRATADAPSPFDSNSAGCGIYAPTAADPTVGIITGGGMSGDAAQPQPPVRQTAKNDGHL
jgi:hypothetical protein